MQYPCTQTPSGFRIQTLHHCTTAQYNWIFLPGGPGLGSEAYTHFVALLNLPGNRFLVDFPNDGSNRKETYDFNCWRKDLADLIESFPNAIIVAHSFAGMLTLATPKLKDRLAGLVIMNSSPSKSWMAEIKKQIQQYHLPDTSKSRIAYLMEPSDATLKADILACAPYFFTPETLDEGTKMLASLPYNYEPYAWAHEHFHPYYECLWVPDNLPCLILSSELDHITPPHLFLEHARFQVETIKFVTIPQAGHFPWFDNFEMVDDTLSQYAESLPKK